MDPNRVRFPLSTLDKPLNVNRPPIPMSTFAYFFSEYVQYIQNQVRFPLSNRSLNRFLHNLLH